MEALVPNTVEASEEKHLPVVTVQDGEVHVNVGSADHPMVDGHYIQWIVLETENGSQRRVLKPGDPAPASPSHWAMKRPWRSMPTATSTGCGRPGCNPPRRLPGIPAGVFCDLITEENARPSYHDIHIHTGRNGHGGKPEEKKSGRGTERVRSLRMLREGLSHRRHRGDSWPLCAGQRG